MKKLFLTRSKGSKVTKSRMEIIKENRLKHGRKWISLKPRKIKLSKKMKKILLITVGVFFILLFLGGLRLMAYVQSLNDKLPNPDTVFQDLPVASEIYDRLALDGNGSKGTRLYRIFSQYNADNFKIEEVPDKVKLAFLAAEDASFFEHGGFDPQAILRCGINNLRNNGIECGASTITQQLVKLTTSIRQDQSSSRIQQKIEELLLASKVEQSYSKEQILLMYLRATPYGSSIVGLKAAANFYFRKEPKDLTLAEAVMLASIIQNPSYLSPTVPVDQDTKTSRVELQKRMDYVFTQLTENMDKFNQALAKYYNDDGKLKTLTTDLIDKAKAEDWQKELKPPVATDIYAGHFVNYVIDQLQTRNYKNNKEPFTKQDLQVGGYKIYTTLDYDVQKIAEAAVAHGGNDYSYWNANNAALLTITPNNGQIIAMAGSKNFYGESTGCSDAGCLFDPEVNVLTSLKEPGSSNKPMGYYEAFKEGKLFTGSFLPDFPLKITDAAGTGYDIKNWDGNYKGINYTAGQALQDSRNIPAIQVVELIGVSKYVEVAQSFGYTTYTDPASYGQSIILGGVSIKPVEHAQAYGIFANGGDLVKLNPILKIVDKNGKTVYEAQPERKAVGDPQAIYELNQILRNVPPGNNISWDGREFAGKTGTTNDNEDSWFVGFSPDMVSLAWVGNNIKTPMDANFGYAYYLIGPWYSDYLRAIGDYPYFKARTPFFRPGNIIQGGGDCNAAGECEGLSSGIMIADRIPPRDVKKITVSVCTDQQDRLARQIDKDAGKAMNKTFTQYIMPNSFEQKQLDDYMASKGTPNGAPTKNCDKNRNGVFISSPSDGGTATGGSVEVKGNVFDTNNGITDVAFTLGGVPLSCSAATLPNFDVSCDISGFENGRYALGVTTIGTVYSASQTLYVNSLTSTNLSITSINPSTCAVGSCTSLQVRFSCAVAQGGNITTTSLWQIKGGTTIKLQDYAGCPGNNSYTISNPTAGSYQFFLTASFNAGLGLLKSDPSVYGSITVTP